MKGETDENSEFLTPKEIAARIGLKTARPVNEAINRGELPAFEPSYNHRIVRTEDFCAWMESKRLAPGNASIRPGNAIAVDLADALEKRAKKRASAKSSLASTADRTLHGLI